MKMKHQFNLLPIVAALALVGLVGCAAPTQLIQQSSSAQAAVEKVANSAVPKSAVLPVDETTSGTSTHGQVLAQKYATRSIVNKATKPYVSGRVMAVQGDQSLPPIFNEPLPMTFADGGSKVNLATMADRLARITGVPVRIANDVYDSQSQSAASPQIPPGTLGATTGTGAMPPGRPLGGGSAFINAGTPANYSPSNDILVNMKWSGTPASYLDHITSALGLGWSYRDGAVVIERFQTVIFPLSSLGGLQNYQMSLAGGNTGTGGSAGNQSQSRSNMNVTETGSMESIKALINTVQAIAARSGGSVTLNEATSSLIITAPKDVLTRLKTIIEHEDAVMRRQVHIQLEVYSLKRSASDERGVDWSVITNAALGLTAQSPATLTGASAGQIGVAIGQSSKGFYAGSKALLSALNETGGSSDHFSIPLIAMNHQWARKTNLNTKYYISETVSSISSTIGAGTPGIKTSSIDIGEKILIQPKILDNGSIILKFGMSLSSLLELTDQTVGSGATFQKVQTPDTSGNDEQRTVLLKPGEIMMISGLSRRTAANNARRLFEDAPIGIGGSNSVDSVVTHYMIIVRATPLPS